nr:actin nucleation-promoting factor WASL isoform X2 [Nothobranchius furzeri]
MSGNLSQRRPANVGSTLLSQLENETLFNCLGKKCLSLSSGVVQVFTAERNGSWNKKCCGAACLVKDNPQRSYFIRVFDIKDGRKMFDQELYNNFSSNLYRPYFITFAGDTCQVGLNFSSENEAKHFHNAMSDLMGRKQRRTEKRRDPPNGPSLHIATVDIKNPEISGVHRPPNNTQMNSMMHSSFPRRIKKDKGSNNNKKKKLTKADIGTPSNFQHVSHVGWNPSTGFDLNNLDPELKNLFDMAGISEAELKDMETSKAIYDFIEKNGGVEAVKNEVRRQAPPPPPPPPRGGPPAPPQSHSSAPPPPPSRGPVRGAPPPPPHSRPPFSAPPPPPPSRPGMSAPPPPPPNRGGPPPPPAPSHASVPPPPPPPPPPPASSNGGPPPPPPPPPPGLPPPTEANGADKSALLSQIRDGTKLKKVEMPAPGGGGGGRDALLDQIRKGIPLKPRDDNTDSTPAPAEPASGIVGALMAVIKRRGEAIHSTDDEDDDDDDYTDEDDEWEDS